MTAFDVQVLLDADKSYLPLDEFIDDGDYLYDGALLGASKPPSHPAMTWLANPAS
jgi:hypothetical protein